MPENPPKYAWEQRLHEAGARVEDDVRKLIDYFNDEVVPDVRRNGSDALRAAARELQRLAQRMDERAGRRPPSSPGDAKQP
ncbi:MAG: hypothetical protein JSS95_11490 [Acidobacteria bacterium]|nr:hypothetical protein [Acidobacteriota bacterium]